MEQTVMNNEAMNGVGIVNDAILNDALDEQLIAERKSVEISTEIKKQVYGMKELMEMSAFLAQSTLVPTIYQRRPENCYLALDLASRMDLSPLMIMQNLYVVNGKPSFAGNFVGALIRTNPRFKNVTVAYTGKEGTLERGCQIIATNTTTGQEIAGTKVTMQMATREGWVAKSGSKWQTMPEQMLAYRAYAYFGRIHCPELLMGLQTSEEIYDVIENDKPVVANPYE